MEKKSSFNKMLSKRGLSGVVAAMILIALTVAAVAIVWGVVTNLVDKQLDDVGSCSNVFGKIEINPQYTCYDPANDELRFSITVKDIEIDELLVSVSSGGSSDSFRLYPDVSTVPNLLTYPDRSSDVKLPAKNAGLTYIYNLNAGFSSNAEPDSVEISPKIGNSQCGSSDLQSEFPLCSSLV